MTIPARRPKFLFRRAQKMGRNAFRSDFLRWKRAFGSVSARTVTKSSARLWTYREDRGRSEEKLFRRGSAKLTNRGSRGASSVQTSWRRLAGKPDANIKSKGACRTNRSVSGASMGAGFDRAGAKRTNNGPDGFATRSMVYPLILADGMWRLPLGEKQIEMLSNGCRFIGI